MSASRTSGEEGGSHDAGGIRHEDTKAVRVTLPAEVKTRPRDCALRRGRDR